MKTHHTASIRRGILAASIVTTVGWMATASHAAIVLSFQEVGANVVATGSGSANLAALTLGGNSNFIAEVAGSNSGGSTVQAIVGSPSSSPVSLYTSISGPSSFGTGGFQLPSSGAGSKFGFWNNGNILVVPQGYVSGTALSGSSTFNGATLASLGITAGTYTWTWGAGATADSLTVQAGPVVAAAVPEPGSALAGLLALGVCLSGLGRRNRRQFAEA